MALFGKIERPVRTQQFWTPLWGQLLAIPEATPLLALLVIGWAFGFPMLVCVLIVLVVAAFVVRLALLSMASRQLGRGAYQQADRWASAALRLNPWSADTLRLRAEGFALRGDDAAAEPLLRRAVTLAPHQPVVQATLAATLMAQGQFAEAHTLIEQQEGDVTSPSVVQQMAWYTLHIEQRPGAARALIEGVQPTLLAASLAGSLLVTRAEAEIAMGEHLVAQQTLHAIVQRLRDCPRPQQAELHYHLGRLFGDVGGDAHIHYRASVALDPQGRYAHAAWRGAVEQ